MFKAMDKENVVFGESKEIWEARLRRLKKELEVLQKYGERMMSEEALKRKMMELESQIYYHKEVLKEIERRIKK